MVLLAVDVGNTETVCGLWKEHILLGKVRLSTNISRTVFEWFSLLSSWLEKLENKYKEDILNELIGVCYSSVVPRVNEFLEQAFLELKNMQIYRLSTKDRLPITFKHSHRESLGQDRVINAIAGVTYYGKNLIIIDFGTAITFCSIINGEYYGGCIVPGYMTALHALTEKTAQLPSIPFVSCKHYIGKNTIDSLQVGMYHGWRGLLNEILNGLKRETNEQISVLGLEETTLQCIATGGFSSHIDFLDQCVDVIDQDLTLRGLLALYEYLQKP